MRGDLAMVVKSAPDCRVGGLVMGGCVIGRCLTDGQWRRRQAVC